VINSTARKENCRRSIIFFNNSRNFYRLSLSLHWAERGCLHPGIVYSAKQEEEEEEEEGKGKGAKGTIVKKCKSKV
jgi:succinylglutamate desuccinylase